MAFAEDLVQKLIAEAFGTFMLVFIGTGAALAGQPAEFAFGFALVAIVYAVGKISGAHVNPAVTLGLAVSGRFPVEQVPFYWGAQAVGAIVASILVRIIYGNEGNLAATFVSEGFTNLDGFLVELIATALFVFVITAVATDDRTPAAAVGLAIGVALFACALVAGPITGGSLNPARSLAPALVSGTFSDLWIYLTAPFIGGVLGAIAYEFMRGGEMPIAIQRALTQRHRDIDTSRPAPRRAPGNARGEQQAARPQPPRRPQRPVYEEDLGPEELYEEDVLPPPRASQQRPTQQPRPQYDPNAPQQPRPQRRRPPQ